MHHPTDRITHTTAFVTPVVEHWLEREIAQWVHPMKDRSDDPSHHERTLLPRSYISLPALMVQWLSHLKVLGSHFSTGSERDVAQWLSVHSWCDGLLDRSLMVDPLIYYSFKLVLHDWCNKGCGMCYPVCEMVHIKEPLLLIGKNSPCGSRFPFLISERSFTICPIPYNLK